MNPNEERARAFALKAHGNQKYGTEPYSVHLAAVRQVLADFGITNPFLLQAAWLHDTIEDTGTSRAEVVEAFGERVASLVWAVSGFGPNRRARNLDAYDKIQNFGNPWAAALKLADRIANAEASKKNKPDLWKMYREEQRAFVYVLVNSKLAYTKVGDAMRYRLEAALDIEP